MDGLTRRGDQLLLVTQKRNPSGKKVSLMMEIINMKLNYSMMLIKN